MFQYMTTALSVLYVKCILLGCAARPLDADDRETHPPLVLLKFDDDKGGHKEKLFGVWRNQAPPHVQHIEETFRVMALPGDPGKAGVMVFPYNVPGGEAVGVWVKPVPAEADWSKYEAGEIVLLLRQLKPGEFQRSVELGKPDTECTDWFKVELKSKTRAGEIIALGLQQEITSEHKEQQRKHGYFELRVPLKDFALKDLKQVHELVIVLDGNRLSDSDRRGALGMRGVVLTAKRNDPVEHVIRPTNSGSSAAPPVGVSRKLQPLEGPVLLMFNDKRGGLGQVQFVTWRDGDPPAVQYIEEAFLVLKLPDSPGEAGFMVLPYNASPGKGNGASVLLGDADWSKYEAGEIVLLLRQLKPGEFQRSVELGKPDTECTDWLKVELKGKMQTGKVVAVALPQEITSEHKEQQRKHGYFELRVPLKDFALKDLKQVHELVIVLDGTQIAESQRRGALAIRGAVVTTRKGQPVAGDKE